MLNHPNTIPASLVFAEVVGLEVAVRCDGEGAVPTPLDARARCIVLYKFNDSGSPTRVASIIARPGSTSTISCACPTAIMYISYIRAERA